MKKNILFSIVSTLIISINIFIIGIGVPEINKQNTLLTQVVETTQSFINNNLTEEIPTANNQIPDLMYSTDMQINYIENQDKVDTTEFISEVSQIHSKSLIADKIIQQKVDAYKEQLRKQNVASERARRGNLGRLSIPSVGIDVAVFGGMSQAVVDAADSAALFGLHGGSIIGDHNYQGFGRIRNMAVGSSAYFEDGNTKRRYVCTGKITNGTNTKYDLVNAAGGCICGSAPGGYVLYTCNDWSGRSITIVFLQPA